MIKTIDKEVTTTESVVSTISCNCCGKTVDVKEHEFWEDITHIEVNFGYGSIFDLDKWNMDICDDCIEKWVKTFKHPVDRIEGLPFE